MNARDVIAQAIGSTMPRPANAQRALDALRAAAGSDRVVLVWGDDGQVTVHGLVEVDWFWDGDVALVSDDELMADTDEPLFRLVAAGTAAPLEPGS